MADPNLYPTHEMIEAMTPEELAANLVKARWCLERLHERLRMLGGRSLWLVAYKLAQKIEVIKAIRQITGLGLREAKALCDAVEGGPPQQVGTILMRDDPAVRWLGQVAIVEWR